ncbi:g6374 [Coccomyxa elongata]
MLLSIYYITRCLFNRGRRQDPEPEVSETSMILSSKELFLVLNPGGATTVAYREDEEQSMVPRSKIIHVKSIVIDIETTSASSDCMIPAYHSTGTCQEGRGPSDSSGGRQIHSGFTEASGSGPSINADASERLHEAADPDGKLPEKAEIASLETATSIVERVLPMLATNPLTVQEVVPWANMHTTYNNTLFCQIPRNPQEAASESDDDEPACQEFHI